MIQATRETNFIAYIETEAERIDTTVTSAQIRHLVKFSNDLDGAVFYAYATAEVINDRYTSLSFTYNPSGDIYTGRLDLTPAGYFKYELYEVSWIGAVTLTLATAPATELDVLPVLATNGVVQGLVAIGKLYLGEKSGDEEVSYTEYEAPSVTNYIYTGVPSPVIFNEYSLNFDGVDDILITPNNTSINPTDNLTVGCWVKPSTWAFTGSNQTYMPFGCVSSGGWGLRFTNDFAATVTEFKALIRVSDVGGGVAGYIEPSAGAGFSATLRALTGWHYVSLTYNKATGVGSIELDGVQKGTANAVAGADIAYHGITNRPLMFGADAFTNTTGQDFFEGNIDEGSVWDKTLTSAELLAVYNGGVPINLLSNTGAYVSSLDLQGWWRMGDPTGQSSYPTILDDSVNSNNATMTNMVAADIESIVP